MHDILIDEMLYWDKIISVICLFVCRQLSVIYSFSLFIGLIEIVFINGNHI